MVQNAAVAQLRYIHAELMAGVQHRQRLHARHKQAPPKQAGEVRPFGLLGVEIDQRRRRGIEADHIRRLREGRRVEPGVEGFRQPGVGVVEGELFESTTGHGSNLPERAQILQA